MGKCPGFQRTLKESQIGEDSETQKHRKGKKKEGKNSVLWPILQARRELP